MLCGQPALTIISLGVSYSEDLQGQSAKVLFHLQYTHYTNYTPHIHYSGAICRSSMPKE